MHSAVDHIHIRIGLEYKIRVVLRLDATGKLASLCDSKPPHFDSSRLMLGFLGFGSGYFTWGLITYHAKRALTGVFQCVFAPLKS